MVNIFIIHLDYTEVVYFDPSYSFENEDGILKILIVWHSTEFQDTHNYNYSYSFWIFYLFLDGIDSNSCSWDNSDIFCEIENSFFLFSGKNFFLFNLNFFVLLPYYLIVFVKYTLYFFNLCWYLRGVFHCKETNSKDC